MPPPAPARISRSQGRHNLTSALPRGMATARRVSRGNGKDEACSLSIQLLAVVFPGVMETRGRAAHGGTGVCGSEQEGWGWQDFDLLSPRRAVRQTGPAGVAGG